jgi:cation diffusion facilitator CzcD-associated flavoprotein CzcO
LGKLLPASSGRPPLIDNGSRGLVAYREFTREGFNVRLFERDSVPGGNWHYSEQIPVPAHYSAVPTEIADYIPNLPPAGAELPYEEIYDNGPKKGLTYEERLQQHRGPKPLWESLHSNAPAVSYYFPLCQTHALNSSCS